MVAFSNLSGYNGRACKVKFASGSYWYEGNHEIGDIVSVNGAKKGEIGRVVEIEDKVMYGGLCKTEKCIAHADPFVEEDVEAIWKSYKPKERKEYLKRLGLDETITKKKFISIADYKWTNFAIKNNNWNDFLESLKV